MDEARGTTDSTRRDFVRASVMAAAGMSVAPLLAACATVRIPGAGVNVEEAGVAELQAALSAGRLDAETLVQLYLARIQAIDRSGPTLRSVQEINPDAVAIARGLDEDRRAGRVRGPLHGIPILLKDNIATADKMETTAGALALVGARPREDSTIARRLRQAGAVILGKASMSEWAYFKSTPNSSGWSARSGQARNPYVLNRTPCGSSSGSAIAVAASLVTVSIGTETDGSIICPAGVNGVVGIKPTVGLTSRAGVIPISVTQDTVGPFGRTVADAAAVLGALVGVDSRDPATQASAGKWQSDYVKYLDLNGLRSARIGVPRDGYFGYSPKADAVVNQAIDALRNGGAVIVDPVKIPNFDRVALTSAELIVLLYEFKAGVNAYLSSVAPGAHVRTLDDVIQFNKRNARENLPYFGQAARARAGEGRADGSGVPRGARQVPPSGGQGRPGRRHGWAAARRADRAHDHPGVAGRSRQRRPVARQQRQERRAGRLSARQRPGGRRVRAPGGHHVHGPRLERADAHQARVRVRAGDESAPSPAVPQRLAIEDRPSCVP